MNDEEFDSMKKRKTDNRNEWIKAISAALGIILLWLFLSLMFVQIIMSKPWDERFCSPHLFSTLTFQEPKTL